MFEWSLLYATSSPQSFIAALPEIYSSGIQWNVNPFIIVVTIHFSLCCFPVPSTSELNSWLKTFLLVVVGKGSCSALKYVYWMHLKKS